MFYLRDFETIVLVRVNTNLGDLRRDKQLSKCVFLKPDRENIHLSGVVLNQILLKANMVFSFVLCA